MRILAAIGLVVLGAGAAHAADVDCEAMEEVLEWTAEALVDIRDGKPANGQYIADAVEFAVDKTGEAGWPEATAGVLDELAMLAIGIEDGGGMADYGTGEGMLGYADALAETMAERCGTEAIPVFVRPGVGDPRACQDVIEALEEVERAMPALEAPDAGGVRLLMVATRGRKAIDHATQSQWHGATVIALKEIEDFATRIARGEGAPTDIARLVSSLAAVVADEAQAICKDEHIPMLAAAGQ